MNEVHDRLVRCFLSVFSDLTPEQVRTASLDSLPAWDSLATVTLVSMLEQEFALQFELLDLPKIVSFESAECLIRKRVRSRAGQDDA